MEIANKQHTDLREIEILRGLGFMAVVLQHVIGFYIRRPGIAYYKSLVLGLFFNLAKFGVPLFVFITGLVLLYNYNSDLHFVDFFRKRSLKILAPYLIWSIIYDFYYNGLPTLNPDWLQALAKNLMVGKSAYHLWFVVLIFQFYLCYPCILLLFKKIRTGALSPLFILLSFGLVHLFLMWFSASYIPRGLFNPDSQQIQTAFVKYRDRNLLFWLYYFLLGGVAGTFLFKWREFLVRYLKVLAFTVLVSFVGVNYELLKPGLVNLNISTTLKPSMFLYSVVFIMLLYQLALTMSRQQTGLNRVLSSIGKHSFGAYLVHALVLNYLATFLGYLTITEPLLATTLTLVLCVAISVIVAKGISMLPFGKYLVGVSTAKVKTSGT